MSLSIRRRNPGREPSEARRKSGGESDRGKRQKPPGLRPPRSKKCYCEIQANLKEIDTPGGKGLPKENQLSQKKSTSRHRNPWSEGNTHEALERKKWSASLRRFKSSVHAINFSHLYVALCHKTRKNKKQIGKE